MTKARKSGLSNDEKMQGVYEDLQPSVVAKNAKQYIVHFPRSVSEGKRALQIETIILDSIRNASHIW